MSEHNHSNSCGCNSHHHEHHHNCSCHSHSAHGSSCEKQKNVKVEDISETELQFLKQLLQHKYLPVAKFVVKSSKEHSFENVALAPVFIIDTKDTMQEVKNVGGKLKNLENLGLIEIDYDIPLNGYSYDEYHSSDIYSYFKETVNEANGKSGFLGDIPTIECGSIAPTEKCMEIV